MSTVQVVPSEIIITDAVREIGQCFSKLGQGVHRWCQHGIGRRTDVKVQILSAWVLQRNTVTEEESRWGFQGIGSDRTTCLKWSIGVTSRRSEEAWGASACGVANRRVPRFDVDHSGFLTRQVEVNDEEPDGFHVRWCRRNIRGWTESKNDSSYGDLQGWWQSVRDRSVRTKTDEYSVEMVLRFLSLDQNNVTLCLTGHYQEGDDLAREQFRRFGRKLARWPSVFSKCVDAQHWSTYSYIRFRSSVSKCSESFIIKRSCSNTKWSTKYQTPAKKSLKDSGHRKGLQNVWSKRQF